MKFLAHIRRLWDVYLAAATIAICLYGTAFVMIHDWHKPSEAAATKPDSLDALYQVMIGEDSLTILSGVRRVSSLLDSVCIQLSGFDCQETGVLKDD